MFDFAGRSRDRTTRQTGPTRAQARAPAGQARNLELGEVLRRARSRPLAVASFGFGAVALAIASLASLTPAYTARVQILIDPTDLKAVEGDVTPRTQLADSGVSIAESQVRVIGSDNVLRRVVAKLDLVEDPEFAKPLAPTDGVVAILKEVVGFAPPPPAARDPGLRALEELRRKISVRRAERTFVVDVIATSRDVEKSALIANTVAEVYMAEEAGARAAAAARVSETLAGRLSELRLALQGAEDRLAKFREENNLVSTNGRLLSDQQLGELNAQLTAASIRVADARARADQARQLKGETGNAALPEMLQSTELRALRQQLAEMSRLAAETSIRLGPKHPVVSEQNAQTRDIERTVAREKSRIIDSTAKELDRAVAAEGAIRRELDRLKRETTTADRALIGARELERDVETRRAVYESFLRRARETGQQERLDTTNIRVISAATPPLGRAWPPSPKVVLPAALLLGLLLGAGLAVLRPASRRSEDEPAILLDLAAAPRRG